VLGIERQGIRTAGNLPGVTVPGSVDLVDAAARRRACSRPSFRTRFTISPRIITRPKTRAPPAAPTCFRRSYETHVLGLVNVLEAMRSLYPAGGGLFYAASSHVFWRRGGAGAGLKNTPADCRGASMASPRFSGIHLLPPLP